jgi:hypothetical protein
MRKLSFASASKHSADIQAAANMKLSRPGSGTAAPFVQLRWSIMAFTQV